MRIGKRRISMISVVFVGLIILVLTLLVVNMLPKRTHFLSAETYEEFAQSTAYIFMSEQNKTLDVKDGEKINFIVDEGDRVSATSVLSDNYKITTDYYFDQKIKSIDYAIDNPPYSSGWEYNIQITERYDQIDQIEQALDELMSESGDGDHLDIEMEKAKNKYVKEKVKLISEIDYIKSAMQYMFASKNDLIAMRKSYVELKEKDSVELTLDNLNFSVIGEVAYSLDGYEQVLSFEQLINVDGEYFDYLDKFDNVPYVSNTNNIIKTTDTNKSVIALRVDSEVVHKSEKDMIEQRNYLVNTYNMKKEGGYFNFIFRRVDFLNLFPRVQIKNTDNSIIEGRLVEMHENEDSKIYYVAINTSNSEYNKNRISNMKFNVNSFSAYVVPRSAICKNNSQTYITTAGYGDWVKNVRVTVYDYVGSSAILKLEENEKLKGIDEIMYKGSIIND